MEYILQIDVRDKDNNRYIRKDGNKVTNFCRSLSKLNSEKEAEELCKQEYLNYSAISGTENISIFIYYRSNISQTFVNIYSYYGDLEKFVKH